MQQTMRPIKLRAEWGASLMNFSKGKQADSLRMADHNHVSRVRWWKGEDECKCHNHGVGWDWEGVLEGDEIGRWEASKNQIQSLQRLLPHPAFITLLLGSRGPDMAPPLRLYPFNYNCHIEPSLNRKGMTWGKKKKMRHLSGITPCWQGNEAWMQIILTKFASHTHPHIQLHMYLHSQWQSAKTETCGFHPCCMSMSEFTGMGCALSSPT